MNARSASQPRYFSTQVSEARRFYLDLKPSARQGIAVCSGGWERCLPDYEVRRTGFSRWVIEFVARGAGTLTLRDTEHALLPGKLFVYGRGIPHRILASRKHGLTKYFVEFAGEEAGKLMRECGIEPGSALQVLHPDQIQGVFDDLITHGLSDHANRVRMCHVALQYLIMKIGDLCVPDGQSGAAVATYQRCRRFIEEHCATVRSLREVADACHVDSAYLCRVFKRFRRQSPFQYLQHMQMNRAVDLMQNSGCSVKEAAEQLGFGDPYNFSRAFKRVFGISPRQMLPSRKESSGESGKPFPSPAPIPPV